MSGGHGLGLFMAIIFLAGEMAGVGVLALPNSMVGTGSKYHLILLLDQLLCIKDQLDLLFLYILQ